MVIDSDETRAGSNTISTHPRGTLGYLVLAVLSLAVLAGFLTHIVVSAYEGAWLMLIGGILFFPLGVGNGWWIWLKWL